MVIKNDLSFSKFLLILLSFLSTLYSQYFGRNKVQYDDFHFRVLQTSHFSINYYPQESTAVNIAGQMLERWNYRYSNILSTSLPPKQPVILYANQADFQQTNAIPGMISQSTGGVTEGMMNRMVIPLTGVFYENDHVLGHELTHAFQYMELQNNKGGIPSIQIPLWFMEGMAEYMSKGSIDPLTSMWMRDAVFHNFVPAISKVDQDPRFFPYRYGQSILSYIAGRWGDQMINRLFITILKVGWYNGIKNSLNISADSLSKEWQKSINKFYTPSIIGRTPPVKIGKPLEDNTMLNLSPTISPDGNYVAYLSARGIFSIDLYLADASTGKLIKKLISSETNEHFDDLRFLNFSGSWSPDSKSLAFIVFQHGDNAVAIIDIHKNRIINIIHIDHLDEISQVAWSPDGKNIAVSGTYGAISNLYIYNLETGKIKNVTNDLYCELQPAWSPDGRLIAFSTDKSPSTCIDSLSFGPMCIGILNLENDSIFYLSMADWARHINPQFSPDGKSLFFISDPDGISDIYRYSFDTHGFFRITKAITGVSGLTELSPAMSVSSKTGRIIFNVFDSSQYRIQLIELSDATGDTFTPDINSYISNASIPPLVKNGSIVDRYLQNSVSGLYSGQSFLITNYHPRLRLWYIGQIFAGIGMTPFGVSAGGSASILFSDILGNHVLGVGLQSNGGWKDIGGGVTYLNQKNRLNWGFSVSHIPYITSRSLDGSDSIEVDGESLPIQSVTIINERVFNQQISSNAYYPFSFTRRFEFSAGYLRMSYDDQAEIIQGNEGKNSQELVKVSIPEPVNLAQAGAALVGDFSYGGFTGPVQGRRYRFEIQPSTGSLSFISFLGDFRKYFFIDPVTLGFRLFSWGRYFGKSEDNRLSPVYLGYEDWIRGYNIYSFDLSKCNSDNGKCPEFERLLGSRVAVFNTEFRVPIIGNGQLGIVNFPYLPLDLITFLDAGVAWTSSSPPVWRLQRHSNARIPVFSSGIAVRFNLLGAFVFQIFTAYPFQRPGDGWQWGLLLAPGW